MEVPIPAEQDSSDWKRRRRLCLALTLCVLVTFIYVMSAEVLQSSGRNNGSFRGSGVRDGHVDKTEGDVPVSVSSTSLPKRLQFKDRLMDVPRELKRYSTMCSILDDDVPNDGEEVFIDRDGLVIKGLNVNNAKQINVDDFRDGDNADSDTGDGDVNYIGESYEDNSDDSQATDYGYYINHGGSEGYAGPDSTEYRIKGHLDDVILAGVDTARTSAEPTRQDEFEYSVWKEAVSIPGYRALAGFKNPCWVEALNYSQVYKGHFYSRGARKIFRRLTLVWERRITKGHPWRLRCLPYFFIAGMPKSGTTDLFHKLSLHPSLLKPTMKEPHWWTRRRYKPCDGDNPYCELDTSMAVTFREYLDIFDEAGECIRRAAARDSASKDTDVPQFVLGEASASTFWDNDVWRLLPDNQPQNPSDVVMEPRVITAHYIHALLPTAKIIVILRDPIERLYSDYLYFRESQSVEDFHEKVVISISNMTRCVHQLSARHCVYDRVLNNQGAVPVRLRIGMYSVFLRDWLKVFPREQIMVIRTEDYGNSPISTLNAVFHFLDLDRLPEDIAGLIRRLPKANKRKKDDTQTGAMLPETRQILRNFYATYNRELVTMLQDSRFSWEFSHTQEDEH